MVSYAWRLTAISLVTHVSTVIVEITPPNAVDTVAVAAAVLVAKAGVLCVGRRGASVILTPGPQNFLFSVSFSLPPTTFCGRWGGGRAKCSRMHRRQ